MEIVDYNSTFEKVFIHQDSMETAVVQRALKVFDKSKIEIVTEDPLQNIKGELSAKDFDRSKRLLYYTPFKGQFFKRCPGARPGLTCCNYFVLNLGLQCNMNCSYCYLQSFINSPLMRVYTNLDQALEELKTIGKEAKDSQVRIGTGEVIDSLSLDPLTMYSKDLIEFFRNYPNWRLEFKTKSALVDQFLDVPHAGNVIVSWSINPQNIITAEEHGTASLSERLLAAKKCVDKGFQISFHIDPMIYHDDWQKNYKELVGQIIQMFDPKDIPYMSVGALRYQPEQKHLMRERFGMKSLSVAGEMFAGKDGKLRYDQKLRQEMFRFVYDEFAKDSKDWRIFMCMESPETWLQSQSKMPKNNLGIKQLFDHNVVRKVNKSLEADRVT